MNQQMTPSEACQPCDQPTTTAVVKPLYESPHLTVFGSVLDVTGGSGGNYDDECTSGKWPGDEE